MDRQSIVRNSVLSGCTGEESTNVTEVGYSPSFSLSLTPRQILSLACFVEEHGFWLHLSDHSVEQHATWSLDLSTIEELTLVCSCGTSITFDQHGREVKAS